MFFMPSPFEALEIFYEFFVVVKIVSITMDSEFFQNVFLKDVRFPLMFQKQIYLNPFRQRCNIRWNNYKDNDRKAQWVEYMQTILFEHFYSEEHNGFLQDCCISLIDKTDGSDPTRRDEYWRVLLKTVAP